MSDFKDLYFGQLGSEPHYAYDDLIDQFMVRLGKNMSNYLDNTKSELDQADEDNDR